MNHPSYVTVYESIGGWKAVLLWWNPELGGFYEPMQTGSGCATREEAVAWAKDWAEAEGVEFRDRG